MTTQSPSTPTVELDARFSTPGASPLPWSDVEAAIDHAEIFWLSTVRRDGRPHVTPLPAMWLDGSLHFCTGPAEQKARNLEANPRCVLTTGSDRFRSGLDVVVEGEASRVTDRATLERLAAMWLDKLDWRFDAVEEGFRHRSAAGAADPDPDSAEPDIALVFAVAPTKVLAFGKGEPYSQTRYRFT
jgi:general stress protein 26